MATTFTKIFLIYICLNIVLFAGGTRVIPDTNAVLDKFIDTDSYAEGGIQKASTLDSTLPSAFTSTGSNVLDFIDSLGAVGQFAIFLINIVFTPLGVFTAAGMPVSITLFFGVPIMLTLFIGIGYFVRSGN